MNFLNEDIQTMEHLFIICDQKVNELRKKNKKKFDLIFQELERIQIDTLIPFAEETMSLKDKSTVLKLEEEYANQLLEIIHYINKVLEKDKSKLNELESSKKKRYAVTIDLYMYADNDEQVKKMAKAFTSNIDQKYDNKAKIVDIEEIPFGTYSSGRKIKI